MSRRSLNSFGLSMEPVSRTQLTPVPEPTPVVKVSQSQVDPTQLARTMTVDQMRTLPSPLKEQTVAVATASGRADVANTLQREVPAKTAAAMLDPEVISRIDAGGRAAAQAQADAMRNAAAIEALQKTVASANAARGGDLGDVMKALSELRAQVARHEAAIGTMISDFSSSWQDLKQSLKKKGRA